MGKFGQPTASYELAQRTSVPRSPVFHSNKACEAPGINQCLLPEKFLKKLLEGISSSDGILPTENVGFVVWELAPIAEKMVKIPWVFAHIVKDFSTHLYPMFVSAKPTKPRWSSRPYIASTKWNLSYNLSLSGIPPTALCCYIYCLSLCDFEFQKAGIIYMLNPIGVLFSPLCLLLDF